MNESLKIKDLFRGNFSSEIGLVNYLPDYRLSFPFKFLMVERVNSRHYRLFVQRYCSDFPSHDCRISANALVSDIVKLALS